MFEWLAPFGDLLLQIVLPSLATIVGGLIVGLLNKQLKKAGIELNQAQQDRIKELIQDAIRATEEAARRGSMSSAEKRTMTLEGATEAIAQDATVPTLAVPIIGTIVDSQLPLVRAQLMPQVPPQT